MITLPPPPLSPSSRSSSRWPPASSSAAGRSPTWRPTPRATDGGEPPPSRSAGAAGGVRRRLRRRRRPGCSRRHAGRSRRRRRDRCPGADEEIVDGADRAGRGRAAASVTGRYALHRRAGRPEQKSLVDTLGSQLMTQQGDRGIAADATTYDRIGQLLGLAMATTEHRAATAPPASAARSSSSLGGAELLQPPEGTVDAPRAAGARGARRASRPPRAPTPSRRPRRRAWPRAATASWSPGPPADGGAGCSRGSGSTRSRPRSPPSTAIDTAAGRVAAVLALRSAR